MLIGVPKEIKNHEYRVGLAPASVREVVHNGHSVIVETGAGLGIGSGDVEFEAAGADIVASAEEIFQRAEMIVKVKEPQAVERARLQPDQVLFTYLHLAPDPEQTADLVNSGAVCIAYETVTSPPRRLAFVGAYVQGGRAPWRSRPALIVWNILTAVWVCCWAGYLAWIRPR